LLANRRLVARSCPDGRSLKAAIVEQPEAWLRRAHMERFGADTRLLVKLLAAGQRLAVHAHPHVSFAAEHLGKTHGKAEARYSVEGEEVYLGLKQDVAGDDLKSLVLSSCKSRRTCPSRWSGETSIWTANVTAISGSASIWRWKLSNAEAEVARSFAS
jgi:hypothetical protein